jgi:carbohydrate-selective porin OprB
VYFRAEYRAEMFTKIPPSQLSSQIGSLFSTSYGQDEHDFALVQLYYEQFLADGGLRLRIGKLDPDDYFNLGRFADDYRYFSNTLFSAFPTANHPSGGLGFNAQWYIDPQWTLTGGMTDVQGKKTHVGFNTLAEGHLIYGLDLTYSPTIDGLGKGNYRLGIEYRDGVPDKDRPYDTSLYLNIDQEIAKDIAPFIRIGWGTGNSTGVDFALSVGLGIDNCFNRPGDAFGVGVGFDTANDPTPEQRDIEYAMETFYRFQITHATQFTIGGQLIVNPINNRDDDVIGVFEMRLVFDF